MTLATDAALREVLLRVGDSCLVLGHRISEWCGHGPNIEEDIALTNIALDLIGQADMLLGLAGAIEGKGRDSDALAYFRDGIDYRNALLCEQPNGDFGATMARQFLFSAWAVPFLHALTKSTDARVAGIAAKAAKEADYHLRHSAEWIVRLGDGTEESKRRVQTALDDLWNCTGELFESDDIYASLVKAGIMPDLKAIRTSWSETVDEVLAEAGLARPAEGWMRSGGIFGRHGEALGHLLAEMQSLARAHPGARW